MYRIRINRNKCIGCLMCVASCATYHDTYDARNRIVLDDQVKCSPIFCKHCPKAECVIACPLGAMYKDPDTGYILYNKSKCVSCLRCVSACPFGTLKPDALHKREVMKCDMCIHMSNDGNGRPMCVEKCPMQAITLVEVKKVV